MMRDVCGVSFAEEAGAVQHRACCKYQMKYPLWNHAAFPEKLIENSQILFEEASVGKKL